MKIYINKILAGAFAAWFCCISVFGQNPTNSVVWRGPQGIYGDPYNMIFSTNNNTQWGGITLGGVYRTNWPSGSGSDYNLTLGGPTTTNAGVTNIVFFGGLIDSNTFSGGISRFWLSEKDSTALSVIGVASNFFSGEITAQNASNVAHAAILANVATNFSFINDFGHGYDSSTRTIHQTNWIYAVSAGSNTTVSVETNSQTVTYTVNAEEGGGGSGSGTNGPFAYDIRAYGAVAGFENTNSLTVAGSSLLESSAGLFDAGDVGEIIMVNGAGANRAPLITTITNVVSATQVYMGAAATFAVTNMSIQWGTNNYFALTNALTSYYNAGGNGYVYIPSVGANRPWLYQGELRLPARSISAGRMTFSIRGDSLPPLHQIGGGQGVFPAQYWSGSILLYCASTGTAVKTDSLSDPGITYDPHTALVVDMENITIRTPQGVSNNNHGVDFRYADGISWRGVNIDRSARPVHMTNSFPGSLGAYFPRNNHWAENTIYDSQVSGYSTGVVYSEWVKWYGGMVGHNAVALAPEYGRHGNYFYGIGLQLNLQCFVISTNTSINALVDFEDTAQTYQPSCTNFFNDPNHLAEGFVGYTVSSIFGFPGYTGAKKVDIYNARTLYARRAVISANSFSNSTYSAGGLPNDDTRQRPWVFGSGSSWGVTNGQAYAVVSGVNNVALQQANSPNFGGSSQITLSATRAQPAIYAKYANSTNTIRLMLDTATTNCPRIILQTNGASSSIYAPSYILTNGATYDNRWSYKGGVINWWINGERVLTYRITNAVMFSLLNPGTEAGMYMFIGASNDDGGSTYEDFNILLEP